MPNAQKYDCAPNGTSSTVVLTQHPPNHTRAASASSLPEASYPSSNCPEIPARVLADYIYSQVDPQVPSHAQSKCLIVDCRNFVDYNTSHVKSAINAFYSKLMRRRLLNNEVGHFYLGI